MPCLLVTFAIPWIAACQASLFFTVCQSLLYLMSLKSVMPSNHLLLDCPLLLLPSVFPASGSFPMSWLFTSGSQSSVVSTSATVLPVSIQGGFHLGLTDLMYFLSKAHIICNISRYTTHTSERKYAHPTDNTSFLTRFVHILYWLLQLLYQGKERTVKN